MRLSKIYRIQSLTTVILLVCAAISAGCADDTPSSNGKIGFRGRGAENYRTIIRDQEPKETAEVVAVAEQPPQSPAQLPVSTPTSTPASTPLVAMLPPTTSSIDVPAPSVTAPITVARKFSVFDGLYFSSKPSNILPKMLGIKILDRGWTNPNGLGALPDEASFKKVVSDQEKLDPLTPVVFDFESWDWACFKADGSPNDTPAKFETLVRWTREAAPKLKIGFYQIPPVTNYWDAQQSDTSAAYLAWQRNNDCYKPLANMVDALYPSLYTFYLESDYTGATAGWLRYATENIKEARRLAPNKPIYAFIWPQIHESNTNGNSLLLITGAFWKLQLDTLKPLVDGVVMWGTISPTSSNSLYVAMPWNDKSEWWIETQFFLDNL